MAKGFISKLVLLEGPGLSREMLQHLPYTSCDDSFSPES